MPGDLVRVIGTVPMGGGLTITGCPGCDVVGCSLFPEGGVLNSIFAKNAWLIGLPIYIVQLMEYFGKSSVPLGLMWLKALFQ